MLIAVIEQPWFQVASLLVNLVLLPLIGAVGYLLKSNLDALRRKDTEHAERLQQHDKEIADLQESLASFAQDACTKEDFLRESARTRQRLEQIASRLDKDEGMKQAMIQIGASLAAAITTSPRKENE